MGESAADRGMTRADSSYDDVDDPTHIYLCYDGCRLLRSKVGFGKSGVLNAFEACPNANR